MKNNLVTLTACLAAVACLTTGCAADPDEYSGSCTLSCSNPRVGSAQYTIEPMYPDAEEAIPINCFTGDATAPHNGPIRVQYRIYEMRSRFGYPDSHAPAAGGGGDTGAGFALQGEGGGGGGGTANPLQEPILSPIMKAGIGFEPVLYGAMAVEKSNDEYKDGAGASPFRFAGIVTPSSEWCSDSCGVISYEFWPTCINEGTNLINAGVAVQGTKSPVYTTFALSDAQ